MSSFQPDSESNINLEVVLGIAQQAGDLVLAMQLQGLQKINSKSSTSDLVTEADLASEKFIRAELLRHYPTFDFWGEESNEPPSSEYFWIVDPIDGTNNFANGLPYFAVNIALNRGDITLIGVTLELPARQLYFGPINARPMGAICNSTSTRHPRSITLLSQQAFLTIGASITTIT
jgi:myo-inositol-1(or 4)-monophosphatase